MAELHAVIDILMLIEQDSTVPKNVRTTVKNAMAALQESSGKSFEVKVDQILQQLDDLSEDPNLPQYTRTQIWNVMSALESAQ